MDTEIVAGPIKFNDLTELMDALDQLKQSAESLDRNAVVYVCTTAPLMSGNAVYLESQTLMDGSIVYNVVIMSR